MDLWRPGKQVEAPSRAGPAPRGPPNTYATVLGLYTERLSKEGGTARRGFKPHFLPSATYFRGSVPGQGRDGDPAERTFRRRERRVGTHGSTLRVARANGPRRSSGRRWGSWGPHITFIRRKATTWAVNAENCRRPAAQRRIGLPLLTVCGSAARSDLRGGQPEPGMGVGCPYRNRADIAFPGLGLQKHMGATEGADTK